MNSNKFWAAVSKILTAATLMLIVTLVLVPGAGAASKYKVLYKFTGGADGDQAWSNLVFDAAGNIYGSTEWGGAYGLGTVYKLSPNPDGSWTESVLYSFAGGNDGSHIVAGLTFDPSGNLFGLTYDGGGGACNAGYSPGCGVAFQLKPNPGGSWTESVVYSFTGGNDGAYPDGGLTFDAAGNLYGTTHFGGGRGCPDYNGCGVVFRLSPNPDGSWTQSVIHKFTGYGDGNFPDHGSPVFDRNGNLYGTTMFGGEKGCRDQNGCGVVFELMPNPSGSWKEKVLYSFTGGKDGGSLEGNLVLDADGNLYGTTWTGGVYGYGTAYKLTHNPDGSWSHRVLHQFGAGKDGANPYAGLVFDATGNLYGTTTFGGANGYGTVYRLMPRAAGKWTEQIVHTFAARPAANPCAELIFDGVGNLYGTTTAHWGGAAVVFEIMP